MTNADGTIEIVMAETAKILELAEGRVGPTDHFYDDLGGDSLARIDLIAAVEDHFDLTLGDDEVGSAWTAADLAALIDRARSKEPS